MNDTNEVILILYLKTYLGFLQSNQMHNKFNQFNPEERERIRQSLHYICNFKYTEIYTLLDYPVLDFIV